MNSRSDQVEGQGESICVRLNLDACELLHEDGEYPKQFQLTILKEHIRIKF
jgi:hypothetical protein